MKKSKNHAFRFFMLGFISGIIVNFRIETKVNSIDVGYYYEGYDTYTYAKHDLKNWAEVLGVLNTAPQYQLERYIFDVKFPLEKYIHGPADSIAIKRLNAHNYSKSWEVLLPDIGGLWRAKLKYDKPTKVTFYRSGFTNSAVRVSINGEIILYHDYNDSQGSTKEVTYEFSKGTHILQVDFVANSININGEILMNPNPFM